jgi:hypothetical protein
MKIKVVIKEYLLEEVGDIIYDVVDKETGVFFESGSSFDSYKEAEAWIKTQEDLTL